MNAAPYPAIGRGRVIDRTCFRCLDEFPTASVDRRVFCPNCVKQHGFPAPTVPHVVTETREEVA